MSGRGISDMKKILLVKTTIPSLGKTGSDIVSSHLLELLSRDHSVSFLGMAHSDAEKKSADALRAMCEDVHVILAPHKQSPLHRIFFKVLNILKLIFLLQSIEVSYHTPRLFRKTLSRLVKIGRYDLVIIEYWHNSLLERAVGGRSRTILFIHDAAFINNDRRLQVESSRLKRALMRPYFALKKREELRSIARFTDVFAISSADVRHIQAEGRKMGYVNFRVVPLSIISTPDVIKTHSDSDEIENSLYFIGSLNRYNNFDAVFYFLEEIYQTLVNALGDVKLFVVGECKPSLKRALLKRAQIHFIGFLENPAKELSRYRVCIAPIRVGSGIKIKILEAFLLGKPVVTTAVGAEGIDFFDDNTAAVQDDPRKFSEEIVHLLTDESYYNRVRDKQMDFARSNLTVEANRPRFLEILNELDSLRT